MVEDRPFWTILDATDAIKVPRELEDSGAESVSLYKGRAEENYWDIAPYLARLDYRLADWIMQELWDEPWGIVFQADGTLEELRQHFRRFLVVDDSQMGQLYFRYYDPRVLQAFLPTCKGPELEEFFGPVTEYWAKIRKSDRFMVFTLQPEEEEETTEEEARA